MKRAEFGVVGLGTMGSNLALNLDDHGVRVAAHDIDVDHMLAFARRHEDRDFLTAKTLSDLVAALERPRRIFLSVPVGDPVDQALAVIAPVLDRGDIVMDGGNSHWSDTRRRGRALAERGIRLLGVGVSGGAEGARHGPSLMPGGPRDTYDEVAPFLEAIAAKTDLGPCVAYMGPDGAGHFVKAVHNGIEYADMQAIAEAYDLMRRGAGLSPDDLAAVFAEWNDGPLESFLLEITAAIFRVADPQTGDPLIETILDEAEQKGTGLWTAIAALELAVPATTITTAVDARVVSCCREERRAMRDRLAGPSPTPDRTTREELIDAARDALYATRIVAFAQGMALLAAASAHYSWDVPRSEVARIWTGGCIIRCRLLDPIREALERDPAVHHLLRDPALAGEIAGVQEGWRAAVGEAAWRGIPAPCWSAALAWYDGIRSARLPHNLVQAQRDWFGAHRLRRTTDPEADPIHIEWADLARAPREADG
jgi:6-phosphogluconate dehydrogenase